METVNQIAERVRSGRLNALDLFRRRRELAEKHSDLNAITHICTPPDKPPEKGKLAGVPIAIKENICTAGVQTTCSSRILAGYKPPYSATAVERLLDAGAVLFGKTNCDEFAMGSTNEYSAFGPVKNPHDKERVPGGSSGGSAAAVAAGIVPVALGSDTGGSVRQPASFCGIVGLKPSYGRISRYGLVAFASSLDQIGILSRTVKDAALVLDVITGEDPRDATCAKLPPTRTAARLDENVDSLRIGIPVEYFADGTEPAVLAALRETIGRLKKSGMKVSDCSLPHTKYAVATYYIIAPAEASSNLARYDGVRYGFRSSEHADLREMYEKTRSEGFGEEIRRRIILGSFVLSSGYYDAYYLQAQKARTLIKRDFDAAFNDVDLLITPVAPNTAVKIGELVDNPLQMYLSDIFTVPTSLAGLPAVSVPVGKDENNLPVGMQIIGNRFEEARVLQLAKRIEELAG